MPQVTVRIMPLTPSDAPVESITDVGALGWSKYRPPKGADNLCTCPGDGCYTIDGYCTEDESVPATLGFCADHERYGPTPLELQSTV